MILICSASTVMSPPTRSQGRASYQSEYGSLKPVQAGDVTPLPRTVITIKSSETKPITVQTLNAVITSPVAACKPSYFTLAPYKTKLVVKAKSSGTVTLPVTMAKTAPQACASRTLTLTFVSTATY